MSSEFTSAMAHPQANAAEQSRMELQARLNGLGGLNGRKLDPEAKAKKLREACEGFESIFIQKMWQEMRNTVPKGGMMHGKEERFWQDMYDQELSKSMTSAGGIGLADMMYEQLSRNLADVSRGTAGTVQGAIFTPSAAPLVTAPAREAAPAAGKFVQPKQVAAIYDGAAPVATPAVDEPAEEGKPEAKPEKRHGVIHAETHTRQPGSAEYRPAVNSGIDLAYKARRDAGDKLSAGAVRPPLSPKAQRLNQPAQMQQQEALQVETAPAHGSAESLAQAMEAAKAGASVQPQAANLDNMVAQAKARNEARLNPAAEPMQTAEAAPVVKRTRYSTNRPNKNNGKKGTEAVRLLNVDNVSVNSNQGKGLAAYHAAQAQASQPIAQPESLKTASNAQFAAFTPEAVTVRPATNTRTGQAIVPPLTAKSAGNQQAEGAENLVIPPLKPGNMQI